MIASAYMVGQLIATVTLPALKFSRLSRLQATASVAVLLAAAWVSGQLSSRQPGFWAYAVQGAQQRGVVVDHVAYAIAFCKAVSGVVLLAGVLRKQEKTKEGLFWPGVGLGVAGMAISRDVATFFLGVLVWELALNILSVRSQARVVRENPAAAGPWIAGAVFLGAATGPALHGLGIQTGTAFVFVAHSCLCGLFPFLWAQQRSRKVVPVAP